MITFRKFEIEDFDRIDSMSEYLKNGIIHSFKSTLKYGVSVTMLDNGIPVAAGGFVFYGDVAEAWISIDKKANTGMSFIKALKKGFAILKDSIGNAKPICHVLDNFSAGERLAKHLGFKKAESFTMLEGKKYNRYEGK